MARNYSNVAIRVAQVPDLIFFSVNGDLIEQPPLTLTAITGCQKKNQTRSKKLLLAQLQLNCQNQDLAKTNWISGLRWKKGFGHCLEYKGGTTRVGWGATWPPFSLIGVGGARGRHSHDLRLIRWKIKKSQNCQTETWFMICQTVAENLRRNFINGFRVEVPIYRWPLISGGQ